MEKNTIKIIYFSFYVLLSILCIPFFNSFSSEHDYRLIANTFGEDVISKPYIKPFINQIDSTNLSNFELYYNFKFNVEHFRGTPYGEKSQKYVSMNKKAKEDKGSAFKAIFETKIPKNLDLPSKKRLIQFKKNLLNVLTFNVFELSFQEQSNIIEKALDQNRVVFN